MQKTREACVVSKLFVVVLLERDTEVLLVAEYLVHSIVPTAMSRGMGVGEKRILMESREMGHVLKEGW